MIFENSQKWVKWGQIILNPDLHTFHFFGREKYLRVIFSMSRFRSKIKVRPKILSTLSGDRTPVLISFDICHFQIIIWPVVNKKNDMTWSRTLELSPQKFDKLTCTCGQILSYTRQAPYIKNFVFNFLS